MGAVEMELIGQLGHVFSRQFGEGLAAEGVEGRGPSLLERSFLFCFVVEV